MTAHTQGPWTVRKGTVIRSDSGDIAESVHPYAAEANARLIAAAPKMLDALRMAELVMARGDGLSYADRRDAHDAVLAAIAATEAKE